jgi:hypothetical protein
VTPITKAVVADTPYVGPRPFRETDVVEDGRYLYGRDREARDVAVMLLAERILVVHSPSGAGKTSLLQAKVIPDLREQDGFTVSGPLRVNAVPDDGFKPRNRYSWSVIVGMLGPGAAADERYADASLVEFLDSEDDPQHGAEYRLLVLDQFEEVLTLDPGDREAQKEFFTDLGQALRTTNRWALLSMREDFMGGLAPFSYLVPTHLKARYRIDFLGHDAALEATRRPAEDVGVDFDVKAATSLIKDLAKVRRQLPGELKASKIDGPYVEPVYLQVACTELWRRLTDERGEGLRKISKRDISDFGDLDAALGSYYANVVATVAEQTGASERVIRDWFEEKLITEDGEFRNQAQWGPQVGEQTDEVLQQLANQYLIRSDQRGATLWYELAHDRLIGPICGDNEKWRDSHLDALEIQARDWVKGGRQDFYLLRGLRIEQAKASVRDLPDASTELRELVVASEKQARRERAVGKLWFAAAILALVVVVETVALIAFLVT